MRFRVAKYPNQGFQMIVLIRHIKDVCRNEIVNKIFCTSVPPGDIVILFRKQAQLQSHLAAIYAQQDFFV